MAAIVRSAATAAPRHPQDFDRYAALLQGYNGHLSLIEIKDF
jgi:hypothetical protein